MALSTEALEDLAARIRGWAFARERAFVAEQKPPLVARPDVSPLAAAHANARALDAALGTWLAETVALASLEAPLAAYENRWRADPIVIRGESPIALRSLPNVLAWEPNEHRRALLMRDADEKALGNLDAARVVVDAFRSLADRLGLGGSHEVFAALGWGEPAAVVRAATSVLDATDDVFRANDEWVRGRLGLVRTGELSWSDRMRTRAPMRASELVPSGDRTGIASRWIVRCGLEAALAGVRDVTRTASLEGEGMWVQVEDPGTRATLVGTPSRTALGAVSFTAATCEAVMANTANEPRLALRAGVDRVQGAVASVLGRRLFLEGSFLEREASVDRGALEPVMLEMLYAELFATRLEAAQALFAIDVMARASDLPGRFREHVVRALGSVPTPAWAAHESAVWLRTRPGAQSLALLLETRLRDALRDRYDEDWFRNPRSGDALRDRFGAMRSVGTLAAFARESGAEDPLSLLTPDALATRVRDVFHAATGR